MNTYEVTVSTGDPTERYTRITAAEAAFEDNMLVLRDADDRVVAAFASGQWVAIIRIATAAAGKTLAERAEEFAKNQRVGPTAGLTGATLGCAP